MRTRLLTALAIIAILFYILQFTPLRFLGKDAADFVGGVAVGLTIGTVFAWIATGRTGT